MKRKKAKLSLARKKLLVALEKIIGESCYNGNIQNYEDWQWAGEGRWFRYPLTLSDEKNQQKKCRTVDPQIPEPELMSGYYAFGSNHLSIMRALNDIVDHLERHHGLLVKRQA